uniref:UPAR/Ly6 domain-containing protein n=1 Tax=Anolis carolinensis TaxID=28377 RepID=H9GQH3_ANOCA
MGNACVSRSYFSKRLDYLFMYLQYLYSALLSHPEGDSGRITMNIYMSNWGCWRWQFCSSDDNYCATTYIGGGIGNFMPISISKGCVPVCPQAGINIGIAAASVKCCSSFLCNISGASSVQANHLVLAAGILASFLYLFGQRL